MAEGQVPLDHLPPGQQATIITVDESDPAVAERLRELGFAEDLNVEVLAHGSLGGDPLVVEVDRMRVALRRGFASRIGVKPRV